MGEKYMSILIQLCVWKKSHRSKANAKWMEQIRYFQQSNEYAEVSGIDGELVEIELTISQDANRLRFSTHPGRFEDSTNKSRTV